MILYNITINIDKQISEEWLSWMKEYYIPSTIKAGGFADYKMLRLHHEEENEGLTYCTQYFIENLEKLDKFRETSEPDLEWEFIEKFRNRFVSFKTVLEVI
jgi:hypothetical protein